MKVFQSLLYECILKVSVHCSGKGGGGGRLPTRSQLLLCCSIDCRTRAFLPVLSSPLPESGVPRICVTAT